MATGKGRGVEAIEDVQQKGGQAMKRRKFLQGLLGGAVAAPSMAKGAAAELSDLAFEKHGIALPNRGLAQSPDVWGPETAESLKQSLTNLLQNKTWRDFLSTTYVSGFDVDIASLQSVSLSAKLNMQRMRNAMRDYQNTKMSLKNQIRDIIERETGRR